VVGVAGGARTALAPLVALMAAGIVVTVIAASLHDLSLSRFAGENRPHYWRVALSDYGDHPLLGSGAGTYGDYWLHHRPIPSFTRTAHSLYLQSLAELGPVGLGLVVAALGLPLLALRERRHPLAAAAAGGYVAYLVHTGIDWDWEMPATTLAGLVCAVAVLVAARDERDRVISPRTRTALLAAATALAALGFVRLATGPTTPFGS
jgi:O-antigen ligase